MNKYLWLILLVIVILLAIIFNISRSNEEPAEGLSDQQQEEMGPETGVYPAPKRIEISEENTLNLSGRELTETSGDIFNQNNLQELNLSNNSLSGSLPAEVRHLENLIVLNLSNNQFTGVPAEVGQLSKLEVLDLSNNQLTGLPHELGNLVSLKKIDLRGNEYSKLDLETIKAKFAGDVIILID